MPFCGGHALLTGQFVQGIAALRLGERRQDRFESDLNKCKKNVYDESNYKIRTHWKFMFLFYIITLLHFRPIFKQSLCPTKNGRIAAGCWITPEN